MTAGLPRAVNTEHEFLAAVCDRLDRLHALIDERLPGQATRPEPPAEGAGPQPVELREPVTPAEPAPGADQIQEPEAVPAPAATDTKPTRTARGGRRTKAST